MKVYLVVRIGRVMFSERRETRRLTEEPDVIFVNVFPVDVSQIVNSVEFRISIIDRLIRTVVPFRFGSRKPKTVTTIYI